MYGQQIEYQKLTIEKESSELMAKLPNRIFINGRLVGIMQTKKVSIMIPEGKYSIMIQSPIPLLYATDEVEIERNVPIGGVQGVQRQMILPGHQLLEVGAAVVEEDADLPGHQAALLAHPDGTFLVIWLIYEFCIRKKYYMIRQQKKNVTRM